MISGLVLKYLNGECFVIRRGYETTLPVSTSFCLTVPRSAIGWHLAMICEDIGDLMTEARAGSSWMGLDLGTKNDWRGRL